MKHIAAIIMITMLSGCAGQTFLIPVTSKTKNGITFVHATPVFRNTGQLKGPVGYNFDGLGVKVAFSSGDIDNATATDALHKGLQGDINQAGSLIFKSAATAVTGGMLSEAAGATSSIIK